MRCSPTNEPVWKWKLGLGKTEWREQKPKASRNSNGCSALRFLMGNSSRSRLPLLRLWALAEPGEIESSEHCPATRWGKAHMRRHLTSALEQTRSWIWTSIVSPNQQWFMCNAESVGVHEKECSKRIMSSVLPMTNCVVAAPTQARDGSNTTRADGKSRQKLKRDRSRKFMGQKRYSLRPRKSCLHSAA